MYSLHFLEIVSYVQEIFHNCSSVTKYDSHLINLGSVFITFYKNYYNVRKLTGHVVI